ncbi:transposase [Sorangium cellulosum]|uniref:Transposase n=1 Tax=Sorangium cellulosum TaxID=56 RepID=A0A2L0EML8_SORCE|nr:transposase [Sorangium cellulosum]AUX40502.1 transposase [Sorangium cellulosum]
MSQPRQIAPGATYLITRRVVRRHLLFRPDAAITELLIYILAVSSRRYGIEVHALCAMSSHLHLVVTDAKGVLPRFLQFFHRIVALGTKVLRKWEGPVWDHEATSVVRLLTRTAVVEKIAYVLANPVAAGLVRHACEWQGAKVDAAEIGRGALRARRPSAYLNPKNPQWIEVATLPLSLPPTIDDHTAESFRSEVAAEIERQEMLAHAEAQRQGLRFLGPERAGKVSPYERATSFEALRALNPTFAVGHEQGDALRIAAAAVRAFRASYRAALEKWRIGVRDVVFPAGTWWMRTFHGASVTDVVLTV